MIVARSGQIRLGALVALAGLLGAHSAEARRGHTKIHPDFAKQPSAIYTAMSPQACKAELKKREIAFTNVESAPGVLVPVRVPKDVSGVVYRTEAPPHLRDKNPFDVFDCRLVLALSDFSKILKAHDVEEVLMFSAWRPPGKEWPAGKLGTRHPGGLAMDGFRFFKKSVGGRERVALDVAKQFNGRIGSTTCGPGASLPSPSTPEARELRSIACEAADQHIFTVILTPDYDRAHFNHFHLEVTPDVNWFLVR